MDIRQRVVGAEPVIGVVKVVYPVQNGRNIVPFRRLAGGVQRLPELGHVRALVGHALVGDNGVPIHQRTHSAEILAKVHHAAAGQKHRRRQNQRDQP